MRKTLVDHIREDVIARLESGSLGSDPLTLAGLAGQYGVSLTPVRSAVSRLVAEGYLIKEQSGRIRPRDDLAEAKPRKRRPPRTPTHSDPEAALAAEVIRISLRGKPVFLREEPTARRYAVGRTVIRQVLNRLAGKGFVEHVPRRGWCVRVLDGTDMDSYLEIRELLEAKALRLARGRLEQGNLARMLAANRPEDGRQRLDNGLHRYIIDRAGNAYIIDFFDRHGAYYDSLFEFAAPEAHVVERMSGQHRAILEALIAEDWPRAEEALVAHIRAQRPIVERLLAQLANDSVRQ